MNPLQDLHSDFQNAGSLRNKGLELTLEADVLRDGDFKWSTNVISLETDLKSPDLMLILSI